MKPIALVLLALLWIPVTSLFAKDPTLPSKEKTLTTLASAGFSESPQQIPATVIDSGILSYVPYVSFRVGRDRELNIYGDPEAPACVEIGLYRDLLNSDQEKRKCVAYLRSVYPNFDPKVLRLSGGKFLSGGVVVEITPPEAPDAYGGWWISVYSLPLVHAAAGSSASVSIVSVATSEAQQKAEWSLAELSLARPSPAKTPGRVYVKSYQKQNGTYVRSHSRSK